jgi:hypothetical protein
MSTGFRTLPRPRCTPLGWLVVALSLLPGLAHACAVCGGGNPANRFAFFVSTMALSLLPLGMFAGGFLWLRSRLRAHSADEFTERDSVRDSVIAPADRGPLPATTTPFHR